MFLPILCSGMLPFGFSTIKDNHSITAENKFCKTTLASRSNEISVSSRLKLALTVKFKWSVVILYVWLIVTCRYAAERYSTVSISCT